jgi:tetratricopeptide (TPR) repeat protein
MYFDRKKIVYLFVLFILPVSGQETGYLQRIAHWEAQAESVQKHLKLAEIYSETGNLKQAVYHFEKAVEKEPALSSLKRLATAYEKYGRPDKAIAVREKIDKADSLLLENRYKLALLYTQNNQKKKAIALLNLLEKADSLNPAYPYHSRVSS